MKLPVHQTSAALAVLLLMALHGPVLGESEGESGGGTMSSAERKVAAVAEKATGVVLRVESAVKNGLQSAAQGIERGNQAASRAVNKGVRAVGLPGVDSAASAPPPASP